MSWKPVKLGEICTLNYGKSLQNYSDNLPEDGSARVFGTNGPIGWTKEPLTKEPTIIVGRKGAYRGVHISSGPSWAIDTAYFTSTDPSVVDLRWFFYRLRLLDINSMNSGAAIPSTKRGDFYAASINLPDLPTQERIAGILSAYDDLIENNRRRIGLLEQAARLLYREWFVHLRFPGHETAQIVDGLPEGWEHLPIGDIWSISYGKNLPTSKISETGKFPVHGADSIIGYYEQKNVDERLCLVTCRGNGSGNVRRTFGPTFVTNNCFVLRPNHRSDEISFHFTLNAMQELRLQDMRTGAAQPQLTLAGIAHVRVALPTADLLERYNVLAGPKIDLADALRAQNILLTRARDLLLPRLMDGRIPV